MCSITGASLQFCVSSDFLQLFFSHHSWRNPWSPPVSVCSAHALFLAAEVRSLISSSHFSHPNFTNCKLHTRMVTDADLWRVRCSPIYSGIVPGLGSSVKTSSAGVGNVDPGGPLSCPSGKPWKRIPNCILKNFISFISLIRVGAELCKDTGPPGSTFPTPALVCSKAHNGNNYKAPALTVFLLFDYDHNYDIFSCQDVTAALISLIGEKTLVLLKRYWHNLYYYYYYYYKKILI